MLLLELVLLLMLCAVGLGWLARHFGFPYPIALVIGGALLGLIPKLPQFPFDPQLLLVIVLPPVLYQAALLTSWSDFKANIRPIGLLAIGLVIATTLAVGVALKLFMPDVPWALAFVLGAIVSPPDAVAATSILSRLNIPRRIVTILEGESLVNDASGLVIYKLAIAAVLTGTFSLPQASWQFAVVSAGGIGIGILLAFVFIAIHRRLGDPFIEVMMALTVPYATYIVAEAAHVSGVLALVAAGLVRGRHSPEIVSPEMRIMARPAWNVLVFMLNSLIFILIGVQMSDVIESLGHIPFAELFSVGAIVALTTILVRFLWVYPAAWLPRGISGSLRDHEPALRRRELGIISWCGMRGIVSLAAALALPVSLPDGSPFPYRNLVIFMTFFVITATLVGQGLTLAPLIRRLRLAGDRSAEREQDKVREALGKAALTALDKQLSGTRLTPAEAEHLRTSVAGRVALSVPEDHVLTPTERLQRKLRKAAIQAERRELIRLWQEEEISDETMRHHEEILDYQEAQL
jgi:CPA1 family monovalent cation:H+ antiporter